MTDREPDIPSGAQALQQYFDDELDPAAEAAFAAKLDREPALREHLRQLGRIRELVTHDLERRASEVPRARFEQVWDEIDRVIGEEQRQAREVSAQPRSIWQRLWAALRPASVQVLAAAATAAVVVFVVKSMNEPGVNQPDGVASVPHSAPVAKPQPTVSTPPDAIAHVPLPVAAPDGDAFPAPSPVDAEIHGIEFGGRNGRISQTGTVTVLYVEDDGAPQNSERSL